ncbi:fungal specific transcription factor domain-containing protein [Aspergillus melleus]|uniref:fungal specific transcription factor domain-containing protein n=1 Tax=Aspergillus melleus TaxID=138277 RepID=UPI001E8CAF2C|nr:uncharacterized protein LDX57_003776 [Aspergillus melleus]KAH8426036.1 hypothetical protein LDX57_003776 [Aspergillus melleus]
MSVATTYCRQFAKSSLAWNFITNASLMCQALGLHNAHALHTESPEARRQKVHLFWVVYTTERMLSLRLGRSSTFRDQDITVPRLDTLNDQELDSLLNPILPRWIDTAVLQGRTYDEIYSPGALVEPAHVRESRARALAAELKNVIYREDTLEQRYNHLRRQALGDAINKLIWHADRVASLSLLTLINRGIPPSLHSRAAFSNECITTAREALQEHEKCISIITTAKIHQNFIELYITCSLLESPFLPFIVLFCHVIETSSPSDLHRLSTVIQTLQSTSPSAFHRACSKQFRLFSALYHVARKYVEVKASQPSGWMMNRIDFNPGGDVRVERGVMSDAADTSISGSLATQFPFLGPRSSMDCMPRGEGAGMSVSETENRLVGGGDPVQDDQLQMQMQPNVEVDAIGTELGNWFYENQQMLKFLDDSYRF